jgi:hypothetical protein
MLSPTSISATAAGGAPARQSKQQPGGASGGHQGLPLPDTGSHARARRDDTRANTKAGPDPADGVRPPCRGMKMRLGGSVRARAYGPAIRDRGLLWENADG